MRLFNGAFGFAEVWTIISFAYAVFVVLTVLAVVAERREPVKTLAWIMVITMFPVGGMILFFLFGRNLHKERIFMQHELRGKGLAGAVGEPSGAIAECGDLEESDRSLITLMLNNSQAPLALHNRVEILNNGKECFPRMFEDMSRAEHSLHIEFFGIESGVLFEEMFVILAERAARGVEVRVIYDSIGGRLLRSRDIRRLRRAGVDIRCFMPIFSARYASLLNYRNHRKIVVIDGKVAYTGGMNIADRYLYGVRGGILRDVHIRVEGEAVAMLQRVFATDWRFVTGGEVLQDGAYFPLSEVREVCPMQIATSGPDSLYTAIKHSYFAAIGKAKRYVYISTPYLLPDNAILTALTVAALSGVDVRVLIPVRGDNVVVSWASYSYVDTLLEAGVRVYLYRKGFNHSKLIVVDDELCTIGSANLDYRSFYDDFEVQALLYDNSITCHLREVFLADLADSEEITSESWQKRSRMSKLMEPLSRLLAPLF